MGLKSVLVTGVAVSESETFRLDAKIYVNHKEIEGALSQLVAPHRLSEIATFSNGINLPKSSYADPDDEIAGRYLSVRGLANYIFEESTCNDLRSSPATDFLGAVGAPSVSVVRKQEVLITRSRASAPGIAMSGAEIESAIPVVPSGFVIRAELQEGTDPTYATAILNHPVWRTFTAGLAAGKSQDNLSQELLAQVPIPRASEEVQVAVADRYRTFLSDASSVLKDDSRFEDACNAIIQRITGESFARQDVQRVQVRTIPMAEVADSRTIRLDNRWHGGTIRQARANIMALRHVNLGSLVTAIDKGKQPTWLVEDAFEVAHYGVATGSIQFGSVVPELLKPTTASSVDAFPVRGGELLVAMDGDGSIGKAAVVPGGDIVTVDSHLARVRVHGGPQMAKAISCWLNSSWGLAQTNGMMSGATGQTQLSITELPELLILQSIEDNAAAIAAAYDELASSYVAPGPRVRDLLCLASSDIANILIGGGAISPSGDLNQWSTDRMRALIGRIHASNR